MQALRLQSDGEHKRCLSRMWHGDTRAQRSTGQEVEWAEHGGYKPWKRGDTTTYLHNDDSDSSPKTDELRQVEYSDANTPDIHRRECGTGTECGTGWVAEGGCPPPAPTDPYVRD